MGNASVLIPVLKWYAEEIEITAAANDTITFGEGGGALVATLTTGTYSWGALAYEVKRALEVAGAGTYTVTYSHSTRKFTIAKDAGTFTLDVGATSDDALDDMGYTSDKSGSLTYTSDTAVPSQSTLTCTERIRRPQLEIDADREDVVLETGRRESTFHGFKERYSFTLEFESVATFQSLYDLWRQCAAYGIAFQFYPDSTAGSAYFDAYWDAKTFPVREMTDRRLYRLYQVEMSLLIKTPKGSSTIVARDLIDRRPSS